MCTVPCCTSLKKKTYHKQHILSLQCLEHHTVMNAKHIEGGVELSVPVSRSRIMWLIPSTCYTQNLVCSDCSQSIPLVKAWTSRNVEGCLEIKGPSFFMLIIHMCIDRCSSYSSTISQRLGYFTIWSRSWGKHVRGSIFLWFLHYISMQAKL